MSMLSRGLGILLGLAAVPALAQLPTTPASSTTTTEVSPISPRQFAPMKFHAMGLDGAVESENWSGYAVTGAKFTKAEGSWIEPTAHCGKTPNTYAAFWVGIDGYSSTTVEQTGTLIECDGKTALYYAWYEFYPAEDIEVIPSITVSPGDTISASVTYAEPEFTLEITDETTGKSFTKKGTVTHAARNSAEWIAEAPCCTSGGDILPLADFGTAEYGEDYTDVNDTNYATDAAVTGPISDFGKKVEKITMVSSGGKTEALPTALTTDGTSFKVFWKSK